jgi:hypothetical protein
MASLDPVDAERDGMQIEAVGEVKARSVRPHGCSETAPDHTLNERFRFCVLQTFLDNVRRRNGENAFTGVEEKRRSPLHHLTVVATA